MKIVNTENINMYITINHDMISAIILGIGVVIYRNVLRINVNGGNFGGMKTNG